MAVTEAYSSNFTLESRAAVPFPNILNFQIIPLRSITVFIGLIILQQQTLYSFWLSKHTVAEIWEGLIPVATYLLFIKMLTLEQTKLLKKKILLFMSWDINLIWAPISRAMLIHIMHTRIMKVLVQTTA